LGFAVKILGEGGLKTSDARRWQSSPHLSVSLDLLDSAFDYLDRIDVRLYRMASSTIPYGTHPDLPEFDYRRQIDACAEQLAALATKAQRLGLRLSTHPGQYTVINAIDPELVTKSLLDLEQDTALLDALGQRDGVVVLHVGGAYGDKPAALARWATAYERLSERAQRAVAVEHDDRLFSLDDVLWLHARTGVRVVYDIHHDRCLPSTSTLADAYATWGEVRPKVHVSSPRLDSSRLEAHADYVAPWDVAEVVRRAPGPLDVLVEAKAKDLAILALRAQLLRVAPTVAVLEQRLRLPGDRAPRRKPRASPSPARSRVR